MSAATRVADPELQRLVARLDHGHGLGDQGIGRLVAQRDTAGIGRHRPIGAAQKLVERPAHGLALDVPQRLVDAAHRHGGGRTHAVAAELELVDLGPDARRVGGIHADHEAFERGVDQMADAARRTGMMALAPADNAVLGRHLHHDAVALGHGADAQRHLQFLGHPVAGRIGFYVDDFHVQGVSAVSASDVPISATSLQDLVPANSRIFRNFRYPFWPLEWTAPRG